MGCDKVWPEKGSKMYGGDACQKPNHANACDFLVLLSWCWKEDLIEVICCLAIFQNWDAFTLLI